MSDFKKIQPGVYINKGRNHSNLKRTLFKISEENKDTNIRIDNLEQKIDKLISLLSNKG